MADHDFEISEDKDIKAHPPETSRNLKRKLEELKTQRTPLVKRKRELYEERARTLREMSEIETKLKKLEEETEDMANAQARSQRREHIRILHEGMDKQLEWRQHRMQIAERRDELMNLDDIPED